MKNRLGPLLAGTLIVLGMCLYSAGPAAAKHICLVWEPAPILVGCAESLDNLGPGEFPFCSELLLFGCSEILTHLEELDWEYVSQSSSAGQTTYLYQRGDDTAVIVCELECIEYEEILY